MFEANYPVVNPMNKKPDTKYYGYNTYNQCFFVEVVAKLNLQSKHCVKPYTNKNN